MPNEKSVEPLEHFAITVDSLERITGINFFPALPDEIENKLESEICLPCWKIKE